ncbi:MAG: hypothetical protein ACT4OE_09875 [Sphingosinicella sp.]
MGRSHFQQTLVAVGDKMRRYDTIDYEGAFWIVTKWMTHKTEPRIRPERIVRVEGRPIQQVPGGGDLLLSAPIPKDVLEDRAQPPATSAIVVIDFPKIDFPSDMMRS